MEGRSLQPRKSVSSIASTRFTEKIPPSFTGEIKKVHYSPFMACDTRNSLPASTMPFFSSVPKPGSLPARPFAIDIAEAGGNEFRLVFRMLRHLLSPEFPFNHLRKTLAGFKKDEAVLAAFFRAPENEDRFVRSIEAFEPSKRIIVRDYYLALLHHISKSQFYSSSFLLSATTSFSLAHKFAWSGEKNNSEDPLILFGWVPDNYEGVLSTPDIKVLRNKVDIDASGLPVYNRSFFPYQQEITLKGGLLPHYLLGFLHHTRDQEVLEINPALFQTPDAWNGNELPIDQSTFMERLLRTDFGQYFSVNTDTNQFQRHER
jgi:hypothetical protein